MVTLLAYPRIHVTLIDLGHATLRANGGAGFAVHGLPLKISAQTGGCDRVSMPEDYDRAAHDDVEMALARMRRVFDFPPTLISVATSAPQHVGLGTKTCAALGTLQAVAWLHGIDTSRSELQRLSGRGGTSGVGISTFFTGGFIVDSGHPYSYRQYAPSSAAPPAALPPVSVQMEMPNEWACHLILPKGFRRAGLEEAAFFQENTPIKEEGVLHVLSAVYHGICPAVASADLNLFRTALLQINETGFKRQEVMTQPPALAALLRRVNANHAFAAGMSSMGPLVYVIAAVGPAENARRELEGICGQFGANYLGEYGFRNAGFEVNT